MIGDGVDTRTSAHHVDGRIVLSAMLILFLSVRPLNTSRVMLLGTIVLVGARSTNYSRPAARA